MKKIIFLLILNLIFLGCSSKKDSFFVHEYSTTQDSTMKLLQDTLNLKFYQASAISYPKFGGISSDELIEFLLKNVAKKTIDSGKKYFFIISPKEVSNYEGRTINTIEGFKENINFVRSTNKFKCPHTFQCPTLEIKLVFVMLDEKSMDYIVWDAKKVLAN